MGSITRLLIANRGEIALRIMRACREMGIETVAVFGEGEERSPHVLYAHDAYRLPETGGLPYLNQETLLDIAQRSGANAVHPGYGFLAENAEFATRVSEAGLIFVGPPSAAIFAMGDKVEARRVATEAGVSPVPGTTEPVSTVEEARQWADEVGYPIAVKAAGGGGGRGFRVAYSSDEVEAAFEGSRGEAERYFSNPVVYLEKYLEQPRHIEIQVFADSHGNVVAFPERDCSIQRRHQKLVEESPSPAVDPALRQKFQEAAERLTARVEYLGAGTLEFLLAEDGSFYFLEMNTRIQVEHTITEMVTGIDLVREQLRVAQGEPLSFSKEDLEPNGWSIECRVNAEDAGRNFAPASGPLGAYKEPSGFGVRVDAAFGPGGEVSARYDSLIAKLITWGRNRDEAISRMSRALADYEIGGLPTTIPFHLNVMASEAFRNGEATTVFLTNHPEVVPAPAKVEPVGSDQEPATPPVEIAVEVDGHRFQTVVYGLPVINGNGSVANAARAPRRGGRSGAASSSVTATTLVSPLQGTVIRVAVEQGASVKTGDLICVVEAMKMENEIVAHRDGVVIELGVSAGATVSIGGVIADIQDA